MFFLGWEQNVQVALSGGLKSGCELDESMIIKKSGAKGGNLLIEYRNWTMTGRL